MSSNLDKLNLIFKLKKLMFDLKEYKTIVNSTNDRKILAAARKQMDATLADTGFSIDPEKPEEIENLINQVLPMMKDLSQLTDEQHEQVDSVVKSVSESISEFSKGDQIIDSPVQAFAMASRMIPSDFQLGEVDLGKAAETFRYICDQPSDFRKKVFEDLNKNVSTGTHNSLSNKISDSAN